MDNRIGKVATAMMQKNAGDLKRIEHSLKVYGYARNLGLSERLNDELQEIVELTGLLHDIGIHVAEMKYGKCTSKDQETDKVWGMRQGAKEYLTKPVDAGQLLGKIAALG